MSRDDGWKFTAVEIVRRAMRLVRKTGPGDPVKALLLAIHDARGNNVSMLSIAGRAMKLMCPRRHPRSGSGGEPLQAIILAVELARQRR